MSILSLLTKNFWKNVIAYKPIKYLRTVNKIEVSLNKTTCKSENTRMYSIEGMILW